MARSLNCPAGQWTIIFNHAFVQIPRTWTITFTTQNGSPVSGEVLEQRSSWIFPQPPTSMPLTEQMEFTRGWWNTFYAVRVKPTVDVTAEIQ
jgi:hypothetical protein